MESALITNGREKLSVQVKTVIGVGLVETLYFTSYSSLAPFFTKEAEFKNVNISVAGIVFLASPLLLVITSPFLGTAVSWTGARKIFFIGMLLLGFSTICFGFLNRIASSGAFVFWCFVCRAIAGIGSAATAIKVIFLARAFPNEINKAMGLSEVFPGVGVCLGPAIGGILYDWGGFGLPFWTIGTIVLCLIPISNCLLPEVDAGANHLEDTFVSSNWWDIMKSPGIFLNLWVDFMFGCAWTFLDPILEPHLRQGFGVSSFTIGGIFFAMAISYTVSSVFVGTLSDRVKRTWILIFVGCFGSGLAILSVEPTLLVDYHTQLWTKVIGLGVYGIFIAVALLPVYGNMVNDVTAREMVLDNVTYGTLSGFWLSSYAIGEIVGPTFGAVVMEHFGFDAACTIIAGTLFVSGAVFCCYSVSSDVMKKKGYVFY